MKRNRKIVPLFGNWRVLSGARNNTASPADWVNIAGYGGEGLRSQDLRTPLGDELSEEFAPVADGGYVVIGEKLIVLRPPSLPLPAA